jgi:hypothetical protein
MRNGILLGLACSALIIAGFMARPCVEKKLAQNHPATSSKVVVPSKMQLPLPTQPVPSTSATVPVQTRQPEPPISVLNPTRPVALRHVDTQGPFEIDGYSISLKVSLVCFKLDEKGTGCADDFGETAEAYAIV